MKRALRISDLPFGRTKAYQEINQGRLRAVKCGKSTFILLEDYERYLQSLPSFVPDASELPLDPESDRPARPNPLAAAEAVTLRRSARKNKGRDRQ
jgi:hypothetical protein